MKHDRPVFVASAGNHSLAASVAIAEELTLAVEDERRWVPTSIDRIDLFSDVHIGKRELHIVE